MNDEPKQKRSTILAIENIKRIADQLRSERNDAIASAQIQRERADKLAALLRDIRDQLTPVAGALPPTTASRLTDLLERIDQTLPVRSS